MLLNPHIVRHRSVDGHRASDMATAQGQRPTQRHLFPMLCPYSETLRDAWPDRSNGKPLTFPPLPLRQMTPSSVSQSRNLQPPRRPLTAPSCPVFTHGSRRPLHVGDSHLHGPQWRLFCADAGREPLCLSASGVSNRCAHVVIDRLRSSLPLRPCRYRARQGNTLRSIRLPPAAGGASVC